MKILRTSQFLAGVLIAFSLPVGARAALPFIEDDYPKAVEQARARHLPLFVEAWAPW